MVQCPFVVLGDEGPDVVRTRTRTTVQWAVDHLKQDFFVADPDEVLEIWLFKDKKCYETHTLALFGDEPTTPYGYYSPADKALIMNIATGGGTLVHEIVHPFMRTNFPQCPAWFNEGLGSLYEQAAERNGHIVGLTNWRLPILQAAIRGDTVLSFEQLAVTTNTAFYEKDRGTNYARSRYVLYYLQERPGGSLLPGFYQAFLQSQKTDPTGYQTLQK